MYQLTNVQNIIAFENHSLSTDVLRKFRLETT